MSSNIVQQSASEKLLQAIDKVHRLNTQLSNLKEALAQQQIYLAEVVAENAEKNKIVSILESLEAFDSSKIKNCNIPCPINRSTIDMLKQYRDQLFNLRRYDADAQHAVDQINQEIAKTSALLEEAIAEVALSKIQARREREELANKISDIDRLLEESNHIQAAAPANP